TYDLFREFGGTDDPNYAPHCEYVELTINGRYHGLYTISERVDAVSLGFEAPIESRSPRDLESREAKISVSHGARPRGNGASQGWPSLYKSLGRNSNFRVLSHGDYSQKVPGWKQVAYWEPYETFINLCGQSTDEVFIRDFEKLVDLDNIIDFHLMLWFNNDQDGWRSNIFIARDGKPGSKFFLIPWDNDKSFKKSGWLKNHLLKRLMKIYPGYNERLKRRYRELRKSVLSTDSIMARISGIEERLQTAYKRDHEIWGGEYYGKHEDNSHYLDVLRDWIHNRLSEMDQIFPVAGQENDEQ
ncbi:MAG: CotH kinase family protein, partial [Kiritimatiellia bacterium]|nr:CotH kinase family protein [Kiritimatiellia bacterium]